MKLSLQLKNSTYKIITGTLLLIGIVIIASQFYFDDFPRWASSGSRFVISIISVYLYLKFSKYLPSSSLLDYWHKNIYAITYLDEQLEKNNISLTHNSKESIATYRILVSKIDSLIKENSEYKKIKKTARKIRYSKPYDIFEALSDCNRCSQELHKVLKKKKYADINIENYSQELQKLNSSLKEIYKSKAFTAQKNIPQWVND